MSKYGFNEKELRKTIVTKIDKDGFHEQTVTYGKDSGGSGSGDWSEAKLTVINNAINSFSPGACVKLGSDEGKDFLDLGSPEPVDVGETAVYSIPMYKGRYDFIVYFNPMVENVNSIKAPVTSENVLYEQLSDETSPFIQDKLTVTGDGTITLLEPDSTEIFNGSAKADDVLTVNYDADADNFFDKIVYKKFKVIFDGVAYKWIAPKNGSKPNLVSADIATSIGATINVACVTSSGAKDLTWKLAGLIGDTSEHTLSIFVYDY